MGRLDDIIERNRNPAAARKRESAAPAAPEPPPRPALGTKEDRLRDIIERNKHPSRGHLGKRIGMTAVPIILLLVLLLLIFTNLANPPEDPATSPGSRTGSGDHARVRDIRLWTPPARPAGEKATVPGPEATSVPAREK